MLISRNSGETFYVVDVFKLIFAFAVVGMHTYLLCGYDWSLNWLYPLFFYSAVPYFFVASGFFYGRKLYQDGSKKNTLRYIKRLSVKLLVFEPISLAEVIIILFLAGTTYSEIVSDSWRSVLFYPYGALWYIQAVIVAIILLSPLVKHHKEFLILPIGLALFYFALFCNRYYFLIAGTYFQNIIDDYIRICISTRNGLFEGFLYVGIGILAAKKWGIINDRNTLNAILLFLSFLLFIVELYFLRGHKGIDGGNSYIMQPFFITCLFTFSARYSKHKDDSACHNTTVIRNLSTSIYLMHSPILRCFAIFSAVSGIQSRYLNNPYSLFVITLIIILFSCFFIYKYKPRYLYDWIR
jgi:peptidoglycan/LPS O-acetylase OafA/YrhL